MPWVIEEIGHRSGLYDGAQIHDRYTPGHLPNHGEVVGHEQHGQGKTALEIAEEIQNLGLDGEVQRRNRLVQYQQLGLHRKGPGDGQTLALPSAELMRMAMDEAGVEAHDLQKLLHLSPSGFL
jgi:hypothetical protein